MTSSQTLSATLRQVRVTSKQLCSVACWMFWYSRSCWVNSHRPRASSSAAWTLRGLEASDHTLLVGWETIIMLSCVTRPALSVPPSQWAPSSPGREHSPPLITAGKRLFGANQDRFFQCMTLTCDALAALSPGHLRLCIGTLGQFDQQADTNIALMRRRVSSGASRTP